MKNKELKDKAPESAAANAAQESELANRRSFMKNLAAGTVAAGALAGTVYEVMEQALTLVGVAGIRSQLARARDVWEKYCAADSRRSAYAAI